MSNASDLLATIDADIRSQRRTLIDLCARLVAAPSASPPGRTVEVAAVVERFLNDGGVKTERVASDPEAPNLIGHVREGAGPHVVFNAHMDTMQPGDETKWSVPVLSQTRKDGRLYGLGMGNMKGALAAMCVASVILARHRAKLAGRISMTAVCDEVMFGDRGAVHLLAARPDIHGDYLISGEGPGHMQLAPAEKGLLWLDIETSGEGGHSSGALTGRTAVVKLSKILLEIDRINDVYAELPPEISDIYGGEGNLGLRVSLNAGTVQAGGVRSLMATRASAQIDIRLPPGVTAEDVEEKMRSLIGNGPGVTIRSVKRWDANWTALDNPLVVAVLDAATEIRRQQPRLVVRLPGSDARRWRDLGVPAVCYGPQPTLSAGIDDYADEQDVLDCARVYARAAVRLSMGGNI